ncbi:response regulator [Lacinutrix jangbogonensis]|uniref:response regulator n=1 Tax=Lacinutrix jangbogonensis TaxID=1469557 RepID=UPI00053E2647|nr:response regulator transcription factor [Lacinutrix jangbogonensis]
MAKNLNIIVADDHPMLLKGLTEELITNGYNVISTAENGAIALELITKLNPDIALLDIEMPLLDGFEVIKKCEGKGLKTKFIILTTHKGSRFVYKAKTLNISGYLLKDEPFIEIQNCINAIKNGNTYFSTTFNTVFETEISPELEKMKRLSPSERTIVRLIAQGNSSKDISESLYISLRTVQKHRTNILNKLDLESNLESLSVWANNHKDIILSL